MNANSDLISRSALRNKIDEYMKNAYDCPLDEVAEFQGACKDDIKTVYAVEGLYEATELLDDAPAVDAVEVDKAMAWLEGYTMTDTKQIYSNGTVFVPLFRVKQAFVDKAYNGLQEG